MNDAGAARVDRRVEDGCRADRVLTQHPLRIAASVGERGGCVDGLVTATGGLVHGSRVGHVTGSDLEKGVVRVHPERHQVVTQLGRCPHEGADPVATLEKALDHMEAQEAGCSRHHHDAHGHQCDDHSRSRP